jgi:N-acetylmuramoyl-L-alanine amidase
MKVIQNLVPTSKYNIKCPYLMTPEFIVVHNTANDASARNEISYMISNNNKVSFHYAIDDKEIVQGIPENRNAWHAGDGNGPGNRKGIGIEICYSKSGGSRFIEAEKLAAKFIASKLKEKGWGIDKVTKHQDYSGKYCPHRTLDMGWQRFLGMVKSELDKLKGGAAVSDKNVPSSWAKEAWEWAIKEGITDGTNPQGAITREQVVTMLYRFFQLLMKVLGK